MGSRPPRIVVGSALLALLIHLDGSGAVAFLKAAASRASPSSSTRRRRGAGNKGDGRNEEAKNKGAAALALSLPFDELEVLSNNLPYLCATLNVAKVHLYTDAAEGPQPEVQGGAVPGKPQPHFYFSEDLSGPPPPATGSSSAPAGGAAASAARPRGAA